MKTIIICALLFILPMDSIYDLKANSIEGTLIDFGKYKGKNLLIVNVASNGTVKFFASNVNPMDKQITDEID
jgi:glutathione peroxidase-family protein